MSILGRWQSPCSSIRSSSLGLYPGSEVSSLNWHAKAASLIRPSLREMKERRTREENVDSSAVSGEFSDRSLFSKRPQRWKKTSQVKHNNRSPG